MSLLQRPRVTTDRGFSLLEMVVAVAILGVSLAALYQIVGGATRIVQADQKRAYAVELARSLVANHAVVPVGGYRESGETPGGFQWEVQAEPVFLPQSVRFSEGLLQRLQVAVRWRDGGKGHEINLASVVAGREF
jgi:general secretion pathway protein I